MDSSATVSLIHLQAYKLIPDTLKIEITLPGELETLITANGSPTHIIGHATITIHLKKPSSNSPLHRSQITDDRCHIRYRLPMGIQNIV